MTDPRAGRWVIRAGSRIAAMARQGPARLRSAGIPFGADRAGRVLELEGYLFPRGPGRVVPWYPNAESLLVLLARRGSAQVDTLARLRGRYGGVRQAPSPNGEKAGGMPVVWDLVNPLAAEEQALLFLDGWIAMARSDPYRVDWATPEGRWVRGVPLPFVPRAVDARQQQNALQAYQPAYLRAGFGPSAVPGWPPVLPPFPINALLAAPGGALAIERTADALAPGQQYDIVDRAGKLTGRIRLAPNERVVGFGARVVFVAARDSDDVEWLRKHPWP